MFTKEIKLKSTGYNCISRALIVLAFSTTAAFANLVVAVPAGSGQWYPAVAADENKTDAFWDNKSADGNQCNVGYWLESSNWSAVGGPGGRCANDAFKTNDGGPGKPLSFFGATGNPALNTSWAFTSVGDANTPVTLRLEVAGFKSTNEFGWVDDATKTRYQLFAGATNPTDATPPALLSKSITLPAGSGFSFYICPAGGCTDSLIRYSNSNNYAAGVNQAGRVGNFALFSEVPGLPSAGTSVRKYWIGVEDNLFNSIEGGYGDFQDLVISAEVVPEPGFYGVLALGLGSLYIGISRRRRKLSV